jgi:YtkA-like
MRPFAAVILATLLHAGCTAAVTEPPSSATPVETPAATVAPSPSASTPSAEATPVPNLQSGVMSENGLFRASWASTPATPPINAVHEWVLHVETAEGEPATGAIITVDGDMPAHGHGMPTQPEVTEDRGNGDYLVEGMSFQMGGYWIVDFTITFDGQTDLMRFGLDL